VRAYVRKTVIYILKILGILVEIKVIREYNLLLYHKVITHSNSLGIHVKLIIDPIPTHCDQL